MSNFVWFNITVHVFTTAYYVSRTGVTVYLNCNTVAKLNSLCLYYITCMHNCIQPNFVLCRHNTLTTFKFHRRSKLYIASHQATN
jgi:hypothetical protein